jgi:hypothetical protein
MHGGYSIAGMPPLELPPLEPPVSVPVLVASVVPVPVVSLVVALVSLPESAAVVLAVVEAVVDAVVESVVDAVVLAVVVALSPVVDPELSELPPPPLLSRPHATISEDNTSAPQQVQVRSMGETSSSHATCSGRAAATWARDSVGACVAGAAVARGGRGPRDHAW